MSSPAKAAAVPGAIVLTVWMDASPQVLGTAAPSSTLNTSRDTFIEALAALPVTSACPQAAVQVQEAAASVLRSSASYRACPPLLCCSKLKVPAVETGMVAEHSSSAMTYCPFAKALLKYRFGIDRRARVQSLLR